MLTEHWNIQLMGALVARQGERTVERFRTRKGGEMLAALALHSNRSLAREELLALLWPDEEQEAGRNRLRVELAALRRQFQAPGQALAPLIEADRLTVRLHPEAFTTDTAEFERGLVLATRVSERSEQISLLAQAVEFYRGDLLPGYDADWILAARERLAALHQEALRRLIRRLAHERDFDRAISYAHRALQVDVWNEEAHFDLIRLLVAVGQPSAAIRQYETLEQTLKEQFTARPTAAVREFVQQVRDRLGHAAGARTILLAESSAPAVPVPLVPTVSLPRTELPVRLTRFFGREKEQAQVAALLTDNRLVTLTGAGGTGKTRLVIETAASLSGLFPGGIRFLYLGNLLDAGQLPNALRQTLRLPPRAGIAPLDQVIEALSTTPSLLILDNFEHIVEEGASLVRTLLEAALPLTLAVTSRRALAIGGEQEFTLAPLPTPAEERELAALAAFASVRLFLDRAQAVRSDFQLTPRNAAAIATLCRHLEGIPLAIELAAARVRTLTPAQMSERLVPRLDLLVNPRADKDARHRSLRATIAWSMQMLSPEARRFFARLAVFQGGWDATGATQVCLSGEPSGSTETNSVETTGWSTFDLLERLQSESLLIAEDFNGTMRFRMLETLREFAWEQLPPREQERLRSRHACYLRDLAEEAEGKLDGPEQGDWLQRLEQERANLTAALTWSAEPSDVAGSASAAESGLRIIGALWRFWEMRGGVRQARRFAERMLEGLDPELDLTVLARALNAAGTMAKYESDYVAAQTYFEQALLLRRQTGHHEGICATLSNLGILHSERGDVPASLRCYEEGLAVARALAIPRRIAATLNNLAALRCSLGDFDAAQTELEEALALRKQIGDRRAIFSTLTNLASLAHAQGDFVRARQGQEEALAIARELNDHFAAAISLVNLGNTLLALHDCSGARTCLTEGLRLQTVVGSRLGQAYALEGLASHAAQTNRPERAGVLLGAAQALREVIQAMRSPLEQERLNAMFAYVSATPNFLISVETGRKTPLNTAISLAYQAS